MDATTFWARVDKSGDCWVWTGARIPEGYGQVVVGGRRVGAHRYAYELTNGPIATGLVIDHLCRNTSCVRPDHLEAVTHRVNILRGISPTARLAVAGVCDKGHPLVQYRDRRRCRHCAREALRTWRAMQKAVPA